MTELYADSTNYEKTADDGLPVDKSEWPLAVEEKLISQEPYLANFDIKIDLKKVDEQSQVGFGSAKVYNEDKEVDIPVVIDDGQIKPFDVMIFNGDTVPLTKDRVNEIFTEYDLVDNVATDEETGQLGRGSSDLTDEGGYLPDEGLYATNSKGTTRHQKISSFLDAIDGEVYEDDVEKLAETLDESDLSKFAKNGTSDVVKKAFNMDTKEPSNDTWKSIKQDNVFLCKESSPNEVEITKTARNSEVADTVTTSFNEAKDLIKNAGYDAEKLENLSPNNPVSFTPFDGNTVRINENNGTIKEASAQEGEYIAKTASGDEREGVVMENMVNFDMEKVSKSVFLSDEDYSLQTNFVTKEASRDVNPNLTITEPQTNDTGLFVKTGGNNYWSTVPFDVEGISKVADYEVKYLRPFGEMSKIAVVEAPDIKQIAKVANPEGELAVASDEVYFVPDDMNFVKMSKELDLAENKDKLEETMSKESARLYKNEDGSFDLDLSSDYDNYETEKLAEAEVEFVLGNHGLDNESINNLVKKGNNRDFIGFSNIQEPDSFEKVSSKIDAISDELKQSAEELKDIDVKVAADLKDKNSVDSILALALVNQENMDNFINKTDDYKKVINDLAEMLLLARLGSNTLPEQSVRDAMTNLEDVLERLREIELIIN